MSTDMLPLVDYLGSVSGHDGEKQEMDEEIDIAEGIDLTYFDPVIYSGHYHSVGKHLGIIGDYLN